MPGPSIAARPRGGVPLLMIVCSLLALSAAFWAGGCGPGAAPAPADSLVDESLDTASEEAIGAPVEIEQTLTLESQVAPVSSGASEAAKPREAATGHGIAESPAVPGSGVAQAGDGTVALNPSLLQDTRLRDLVDAMRAAARSADSSSDGAEADQPLSESEALARQILQALAPGSLSLEPAPEP